MAIGQMDRRVVLKTYTESRDAYGQPIKTWSTLATVWAKVMTDSGGEGQDNKQEIARSRVLITIRYRSDIDEMTKVTYDSQDYDIINIKEIGRREYQELTTTLRDNQ